MNEIHYIDFSSLTVTVASLNSRCKKHLKKNLKEYKQRKKIIENEKWLNKKQ